METTRICSTYVLRKALHTLKPTWHFTISVFTLSKDNGALKICAHSNTRYLKMAWWFKVWMYCFFSKVGYHLYFMLDNKILTFILLCQIYFTINLANNIALCISAQQWIYNEAALRINYSVFCYVNRNSWWRFVVRQL